MSNLKDLLTKIRIESPAPVVTDTAIIKEMEDEEEYEGAICFYLNEDGTCSDGCSCANVEVEQECPFMSDGDFESCCCFEDADSEAEDYSEEEFEDE